MRYLRYWRLVAEKKQTEVARDCGISQGHYCDIERRGVKPRDPKLYGRLAESLGRPKEELISKLHGIDPADMALPAAAAKE